MKNIWRILSNARSLWPLYVGIIIGAIVTTVTSLLSPFVIAQGTQIVVDMIGGKTNATITTLVWLACIRRGWRCACSSSTRCSSGSQL